MKRRLVVGALLAICLSLVVYGTTAFFTTEQVAHNVITTGNVDIDLLEWVDIEKTKPFPKEGLKDVMPGDVKTKIVEVKNVGSSAAYVRIRVDRAVRLANSLVEPTNLDLISLDINKEAWTEKDGYYYYNTALAKGETTIPLFTTVTLSKAMDNLYAGSTLSVYVSAQAVQAANNGSSVLEAKGWPQKNEA